MKVKDLVFKKIRIRVQLLIVLTVCITLFSFFMLLFSITVAGNIVEESIDRITYTVQYGSGNELNLFFKRISTSASLISQNRETQHFFNGDDNISIALVDGLSTLQPDDVGAVVLCREETMEHSQIYGETVAIPNKVDILESNVMQHFLVTDTTYQNQKSENFLILATHSNYGKGGYVLTYIRETAVSDIINRNPDIFAARWLNDNNRCLSSINKNEIGTVIDINQSSPNQKNIFSPSSTQENGLSVSYLPIELSGKSVTVAYDVNYSTLWSDLYALNVVIIAVAAFMIISLVGFTFEISQRVVSPIEQLNKNISNFDGKHSIAENHRKYNELVELSNTFDDMTERITELIEKNNRDMERQRALELAALQIQINPHFLYNTLDTVAWISKLQNQPDIEKLVVSLARFFRISLHNGDKYVRVYEELDLLKNYINIENIRFPNKIKLHINVDGDIRFSKMLKIILQPIVEDSMKHGFTGERSGNITINGFREGEDLIFEIVDDGVGFEVPEDFLQNKTPAPKDGSGGYGLKNVDERIKLAYGEQYGLTCTSKPGVGTKTTVRIKDMPVDDDSDT